VRRRGATSKRYAKALVQLALDAGRAEEVGAELQEALTLFHHHPKLSDLLLRPWVKGAMKQNVVAEVAERSGWSAPVKDFLGLLAARGRMDHLQEIVLAYQGFVDEAFGRVRARVRTAVALTDEDRRQISEHLSRALGKEVLVEEAVDRKLLGGFVAEIGSLVLDSSLDGQLSRMRERLVKG
jgi:F-type H+-transporting ATPase subunit delta